MLKTFTIDSFLRYLNIKVSPNDAIQVIYYDEHPGILLKSAPVGIDFYLLALKDKIEVQSPIEEMSDSYLFLDKPGNSIEWDLKEPFAGYAILVNEKLLSKTVKDVSFADYDRHETLFLTGEEKETLYDLFKKAHNEFQKRIVPQRSCYPMLHLFCHTHRFITKDNLKPGVRFTIKW